MKIRYHSQILRITFSPKKKKKNKSKNKKERSQTSSI